MDRQNKRPFGAASPGSTEEQALGNLALSKCTMIGTALLGAILVLASLHSPRPASAQPQGQSSAQLEAELSSKTADLNKAQADLLQIKAGITAIDSFSTLPEGRLKREAKNQAYRSYIQYVEGLDPDLAPFANVVASPEEIKKSLQRKLPGIERKIAQLNTAIAQLQAKVQQAKLEELSQQVQQRQPGGSSGGTKSQSGPPQPSSYTAPPQPPPGDAGRQPPMLPPGAYVMGLEVSCPGEAMAGETVRCTAIGVFSHDPYTVVDLTGSTEWTITGATEWQRGSAFRTRGAAVVVVTATRGENRVTRTVHVKAHKTCTESGMQPKGASPASPPTGGGGCGPMTSCTCKGGGKGHIPCDKEKGACHCGAM